MDANRPVSAGSRGRCRRTPGYGPRPARPCVWRPTLRAYRSSETLARGSASAPPSRGTGRTADSGSRGPRSNPAPTTAWKRRCRREIRGWSVAGRYRRCAGRSGRHAGVRSAMRTAPFARRRCADIRSDSARNGSGRTWPNATTQALEVNVAGCRVLSRFEPDLHPNPLPEGEGIRHGGFEFRAGFGYGAPRRADSSVGRASAF